MKTISPHTILATAISALVSFFVMQAGVSASAAAEPGAAPGGSTVVAPRLLLQALERTSPGWVTVESESGPAGGRVVIERVVWPLFYLHWMPLSGEGGVGEKLSVEEAEKVVAGLWKGFSLDTEPHGQKVSMPAHEAVLVEGTASHGEWKSRYLVWACRESGRLFIADMNVSLQSGAPPELFDLMNSMSRSVKCHAAAKVEELPPQAKRREIPDTDISYGIPFTWSPVAGYRVQDVFGTGQFSAQDHPAVTNQAGQDVAVELDSVRRLHVLWEPAPDSAMTFDTLIEKVHAFWQERAHNMLPAGTKMSNDIWMMDGLVQFREAAAVPPSRMHKFRAWSWRKNGTSYLAIGEIGGIRFGQRVMTEMRDVADPLLEELFQSIEY